jgi:hypothetical protein
MNSGTVEGTSVPAFADFTYCNLHFACFLVTISDRQLYFLLSLDSNPHRSRARVSRGKEDQRARRRLAKSENPIFCQKLVSVENTSGSSGEVHQFSMEISGKWTRSIGVIADCGVAVSASQPYDSPIRMSKKEIYAENAPGSTEIRPNTDSKG